MSKNTIVNEFTKIKLKNNTKEAMETGWKIDPKTHYKDVDLNLFNAAFPCGEINNIIILDVDKKDGGIEAIEDYKREFGDFTTFTVSTPNGGFHHYFNYNSQNNEDDYLLKEFINHTKLRGVGLDIRTERGYIVAPGSSIDGNYYNIINDVPICDMPSNLITWLTAFKRDKKKKDKTNIINQVVKNEYTYILDDNKIKEILDKLDKVYVNNYSDWLRVSTVLKFHDKYDLWNEWSKKSTKYDEFQNIKIWNSISGCIDINYLCAILGLGRIDSYIPINYEMKPNNKNIDYIEYNNKFIFCEKYKKEQLDYNNFVINDTIILKGTAGTGKTTAISKHINKYMEANPEFKFISIVDRITLNDQHMKSFKNINIKSYKDKKADMCLPPAIIICINSLQRLAALTKEAKNKYIVFIDEITSFLNLTHNDTLKTINYIYNLLTSIIKNAHKVIVADAIILDNTLDFLKSRINEDNKTLFIYNKFKKFEGVKAIHIKNEELFLNKIINECKAGKPFLFGCDKAIVSTRFYNKCKTEVDIASTEANKAAAEAEAELTLITSDTTKLKKEVKKALIKATKAKVEAQFQEKNKNSFILITADTNIEIYDAEKQFEGKFVFYSPKITYGVDFSIDTAQNVYIYQTGIIKPNGTFQQSTRCRNIKELFYYSDGCTFREEFNKDLKPEHWSNFENNEKERNKTLKDISDDLKQRIEYFKMYNSSLYNVSTIYNEDKEIYEVNENSFFFLYCYIEYINKIYKMNMNQHYKDILINNGFVLSEEGETRKITNKLNTEIKEITKEIKKQLFIEYIDANDKTEEKYDSFNKHVDFLKIPRCDNEILTTYKYEITDKYGLQNHINIIRILKDDTYISEKLQTAINNSYDVKNISSVYNKIKAIRTLENKYNIKKLQVDFQNNGPIEMDEDQYKYIKSIFRISTPKPKDYDELKKIYISMIKNVTTNDFIKSRKSNKKETRDQYLYNINNEYIQFHLKLNNFSNIYNRNFHEEIKNKFEIVETEPDKNSCPFDNDDYEYDVDVMCAELDIIL